MRSSFVYDSVVKWKSSMVWSEQSTTMGTSDRQPFTGRFDSLSVDSSNVVNLIRFLRPFGSCLRAGGLFEGRSDSIVSVAAATQLGVAPIGCRPHGADGPPSGRGSSNQHGRSSRGAGNNLYGTCMGDRDGAS
jgi:hypothetical protein